MSKLSRSASKVIVAFGFAAAFLCLSVGSASAAPSFDLKLESDPLANEVQRVTVKATGGQYRLNFGEGGPGVSETADIAFDASTAEVAAALNALTNISSGGGSVSVTGGPGDELGTSPYLVAFSGGPLRMSDVEEMSVSPGTTPLSGGSALAAIRTTNVGGVTRSDFRTDYTVRVKNAASANPGPGDILSCNPNTSWFNVKEVPVGGGTGSRVFEYQWIANGTSLGPANGAQTATYTVQAADAGKALQCIVTATNNSENSRTVSFSNPLVASPVPALAPPTLAGISPTNRPSVTGTATANSEITCTAPTGWTGSPTWTFEWLRNGSPVTEGTVTETTATTSKLQIGALEAPATGSAATFQCKVIGKTGTGGVGPTPTGGTAVAFSANKNTTPAPSPPAANNGTGENRPFISFSNGTTGTVTAEVELPTGQETYALKVIQESGATWTCAKHAPAGTEPAKVTCTRSDVLPPQVSYPPFTVAIALGADAPDLSTVKATVSGGGAPTASTVAQLPLDQARPFEITAFETEVPDPEGNEETQAGAHPIQAKASFTFSQRRNHQDPRESTLFENHLAPIENVKHINTHTPRGFVGNALAVPELCPTVEATLAEPTECPEGSIVGGISLRFEGGSGKDLPIYSIKPEYGTPAQFAFPVPTVDGVYTFFPELRADDSYAISLISAPVNRGAPLRQVDATLCGFGAKTRFFGSGEQNLFDRCKQPGEPGANPTPLVTLPTRCAGDPPSTELEIDSWQKPGQMISREFEAPQITGCDQVPFEPTAEVRPTSNQADSPTGLDVELTLPTEGLEGKDPEGNLDPEALAQANMKTARVTFPEGMAINPSAGQGLGSCSIAQAKMGTNDPHECPDSSKIGTIEIDTPIIQETLTGAMYVGKQSEAPEGSLIGLYLIFESKVDGIIIKIPGEVKTNPVTGQLVTTFDDILEDPFSRVQISFQQGPRASLLTPPRCGTYEVKAELVPWTVKDLDNPDQSEIVTNTTSFDVTQGPGGGPCPTGALEPKLSAGTTNPLAGQHTGFELGLSRNDGTQRVNGLELSLPPGILGVLKGIPYCPEASIQAAMSRSDTGEGQQEIDSPSCPSASRIGSVSAGAGGGPNPIYVDTGKAYLAGPYKGAPLSLVVIAPAVAGPLDLGTVVVRNQLRIDRRTAQITAVSDPIPTILHGVLLDIRDVRMKIDRQNFVLNPTNCEQMAFNGQVSGESGAKAPVSDRFQLSGCENLGFKPNLRIVLKGGTKRGDHPSLLATLKARPGDANIARAAVTLPRSAFLDQAHIRTICTRVQFAAESCPPGAIYGSAEATTPLLDETLKGNVILRSSDNKLPDLVGTLNGIATVDVVGRIDSIKGGIRNTFDVVPDAPVDQFVLRMQGGKKGLVINSQDLCAKANRATVRFTAQNGRTYNYRPVVVADGCGKAKKGRKGAKGKRRGGGPKR